MRRFVMLYALALSMLSPVQEASPYRVPNPDHAGHFKRPDGARCQTKGDHPCQCEVVCSHNGGVLAVRMSDQCQWYCEESKCTCHPCPESECGENKE